MNVIDTQGRSWTVTNMEAVRRRAIGGFGNSAQLYPGFTQLNLNNRIAITLPILTADRWMLGKIRVRVDHDKLEGEV